QIGNRFALPLPISVQGMTQETDGTGQNRTAPDRSANLIPVEHDPVVMMHETPENKASDASSGILTGTETSGGGGIRTHGELAPTTVFKTAPIGHPGTPPSNPNPPGEQNFEGTYWPTSSMISSATKIGTSTVTATAMASLGLESTSTISPSCRIR